MLTFVPRLVAQLANLLLLILHQLVDFLARAEAEAFLQNVADLLPCLIDLLLRLGT